MKRAHQILAVVFALVGAALVVRGVAGGPLARLLQALAGLLMLVLAVLRWIYA